MNITILMADQCSSTSISATKEFFETANALNKYLPEYSSSFKKNDPLFKTSTASVDGQPVTCTGGLIITPDKKFSEITDQQLIVVPGFMFNILGVLPKLIAMVDIIKELHDQGCYIASLCTGSFVTAQAELLNDRYATTHWAFSEQFIKKFPKVKLQTERTVTDDGQLLCSGGSTSSSDLLIYMIRKFASPQLAAECAKKLLVDNEARSQKPYSSTTFKKNHTDPVILKAQIWYENNITKNIEIDELAKTLSLSTRNFIRRFKEATTLTPHQYLQDLRTEKAKHLLEVSSLSFEQITAQVGYEDNNSFRRLFKKKTGLTSSEYRKRFRTHLQHDRSNHKDNLKD